MPIGNLRRKARSACFLLMLLTISLAVSAVFAQSGEMPLTASKEAVALFKQGLEKAENLEDAGTLFDQAIQKDPNFAFGYLFAGQNNREFQQNLEKAVKLADKASPGEREWIMAVWEQNNANSAAQLTHLKNLLKLHPNDKRAHIQMAGFYGGVDDTTALKHLNEAVRIDTNYAPAYNSIGYANMALGKYADAEMAFKTYVKLIPNNPNPYDSYAEMLMRTGNYDASIKQYAMALAKDPTFVASYRGMGNNYAFKGDFAKSREIYQTMYDKSTNEGNRNQALTAMTNAWLSEGNTAKALEIIAKRIAGAEKEGDIATVMGLNNLSGFICVETGDLACAAKYYAIGRKLVDDPALPSELRANRQYNARLNQIRVLGASGEFDKARGELEAMRAYASANTPNAGVQFAYNYAVGYIELKQKNYEKAAASFAKANQTDPYVWYYQALAYDGAGNASAAAGLYKKVVDRNQLDTTGFAIVRPRAQARLKK
jgi:tetratricopeptide (TPR) repeat protein